MTLKKTLLDVAKRTAAKRFRNKKDTFAGIELDIDAPEEHTPSPLRLEEDSNTETIDQQRRGSVRRLLRDRFVDDGGYLQSRTPFPLNAPAWDQIDQDRPSLTPEGQLWEDMNHFVDYLVSKDVSLAFHLNQMFLESPKEVLSEFNILCRSTNKPLCRHEVIGRGYVFSKEPVLSPSVLVASLVLNRRVKDFEHGLKYLWIVDRKLVDQQRGQVQGFDLEMLVNGALMLLDSFRLLQTSVYWNEVHFVEELKELSFVFPDLAMSLSSLKSRFVFAEILLNRKTAVRRCLELQRILREELNPIEILNDLGSNPEILLQTDEDNFQSILQWIQVLKELRVPWSKALESCKILFEACNEQGTEFGKFSRQFSNLGQNFPKLVRNALDDESSLRQLAMNLEVVSNKASELEKIDDVGCQILGSVASLLTGTKSVEDLISAMQKMLEVLSDWDLYGKCSIDSLLNNDPNLLFKAESQIEDYKRIKSLICCGISKDEMEDFQQRLELQSMIECFRRLQRVVEVLEQDFHLNEDDIKQSFIQSTQRIRSWKHRASLPGEIILLLNSLPANRIAELLMMDSESMTQVERPLFLMFGRSPEFVFSCLMKLPELIIESDSMDLALSVARCKKVTMANLRDESYRYPDQLLTLLMATLRMTRSRTKLKDKQVVLFLERLTRMKLLSDQSLPIEEQEVAKLTQFLILSIEHPTAWRQFIKLMDGVHNPVLECHKSELVDGMKREAFGIILEAPEVFLLSDLWDAILSKMQAEGWSFARLDLETVQETEPCLLFYAVQHYWKMKYKQDPLQLISQSNNVYSNKRTM